MDPTDNKSWVSGRTEEEALKKAAKSFGIKDLSTITLKQVCSLFLNFTAKKIVSTLYLERKEKNQIKTILIFSIVSL